MPSENIDTIMFGRLCGMNCKGFSEVIAITKSHALVV